MCKEKSLKSTVHKWTYLEQYLIWIDVKRFSACVEVDTRIKIADRFLFLVQI